MYLHIAICEDDARHAKLLEKGIERWAQAHQLSAYAIHSYSSPSNLLNDPKKPSRIDIFFLDIDFPGGISGMKLAQRLRDADEEAAIIFITNHSEYAMAGYDVQALYYFKKPILDQDIEKAMNNAYKRWLGRQEGTTLLVKAEGVSIVLLMRNIYYVEVCGHALKIHCADRPNPVVTRMPLSDLLEKLAGRSFIRCHRSFIVNLRYSTSLTCEGIEILGEKIAVGKKYLADTQAAYYAYHQGGNAHVVAL